MSDLPDFIWHTDGKRWSDKYVKRLRSQRDAATKELVLCRDYGRKKREENKKLKAQIDEAYEHHNALAKKARLQQARIENLLGVVLLAGDERLIGRIETVRDLAREALAKDRGLRGE